MTEIFNCKIGTITRILVLIGSLLILVVKIAPLWEIGLTAPQYPEGLNLQIWAHKFTGDVQTINILNHYVGMAAIKEEAFPELQYFPTIFAVLTGLGVLAAIINRKFLYNFWATVMVTSAVTALVDFYQWEYKFGHDLNPDAAIKMEDMVYQPPIIGEKTFLNITASSWPGWGGIAFTMAVLVAFAVLLTNLKFIWPKKKAVALALLLCFIPYIHGCTKGQDRAIQSVPIIYGKAVCDHCRMLLVDKRFGAEIVTGKGKSFVFDSIECLKKYEDSHKELLLGAYQAFVINSKSDTDLIRIEEAHFYKNEEVHGPMGSGFMVSRDTESKAALSWKELRASIPSH